ncbi:thioredoxin family protein [Massilia putida]|uniref:thioredoxin family protein n=1 Tax=Massilia putida TaxID=1141883 RepID=UPI0009516DBE|nr:thioredoxin family protein [Massilia putida]
MSVRIELIAAPGCGKCAVAQAKLHAIATTMLGEDAVVWREVNVLEELDYAVSLGVLSMPAIAVNGELKFSSLPTPERFRAMLSSLEHS